MSRLSGLRACTVPGRSARRLFARGALASRRSISPLETQNALIRSMPDQIDHARAGLLAGSVGSDH